MMMESPDLLLKKVQGCLYGGAIGDAMGAPAEWRSPAEIRARYGYITDLVEAWDAENTRGRGHGRYTDDTHMAQLLCECYREHGDHLDAHEFLRRIVPKMALEERWIPERERHMPLVERLFYPEKWLYIRWLGNADPRNAGVGNMVNCGAAMYAAPVGIINACDPQRAYVEAIDIFSAHQHSYGLEAAGVMAAAVAAAFAPDATVGSVIDAALAVAKDGTRACIEALVECAADFSDWREAIAPLREVMRRYDGSADDAKAQRGNGRNDWTASREHSIEEAPIALAFLVVTGGDFEGTVFGGTNYGRDNDSIAGMGGAIAGAMQGIDALRDDWLRMINSANAIDLMPLAQDMAALTRKLQAGQFAAAQERQTAFAALSG
ncbi:MAG: ADP-ribosylglycohydrolase family protein [Chloroflexi bacterium]|nr:ADP-ribosylglycohydrolase family protein [Chloroflexota bacterium]MCY3716158.1 ADP-ribosylglycohydrolase family protein [Chloroflexota bacterium]MDE2650975.1 ADP-ribosylglycohydrolase family protein [Chloroflexota bacterium]MXV94177.1 ADP-ribosylglycohydrolase family protein [Chloroflexota bacterium]MXX84407.1 ADP-ribosylglycohydrolase family protein [Chloroflexota bacterium]